MIYDTHTHLNFKAFKDEADIVFSECEKRKIKINIVGSNLENSILAFKLSKKYSKISKASLGFHPIHIKDTIFKKENFEEAMKLYQFEAIGETGLDYYRLNDFSEIKIQKHIFEFLIDLSVKNNVPLIIHCREAYKDLIEILNMYKDKIKGVVHCFLGDKSIAKKILDLGLYISFTGIITFKNVDISVIDTIKFIPKHMVLIETDCPYLAPSPFRGKKNYPWYVEYVGKKILEIRKDISFRQFYENSIKLFGDF